METRLTCSLTRSSLILAFASPHRPSKTTNVSLDSLLGRLSSPPVPNITISPPTSTADATADGSSNDGATSVAPNPHQLKGAVMWMSGVLLALANFVAILDVSIANVSVPNIAGARRRSSGWWRR